MDYEFRTTLVRELHRPEDLDAIAAWLAGAPRYYLQNLSLIHISAAVTAGDLADQVYIYEKEGFGSDFYIALNSDGSMRCSEGALSSY